jgi:hypothetical protein
VLAVCGLGLALGSIARAQSADECLVFFKDTSGQLADGTTLCQVASKNKCVFSLDLCLNDQQQQGCQPATFSKKQFRAMGHCGPVGKLKVTPGAGTDSACGAFTDVTVRTRSSGKKKGACTVMAAVRTAKTHARTDVDKIKLVCQPPSGQCP